VPHPELPEIRILPGLATAYQADLTPAEGYGRAYWDRYGAYRGTPAERTLMGLRVDQARRAGCSRVLDVGIGNGAYLEALEAAGIAALGSDVAPDALEWLRRSGRLADPYGDDFPRVDGVSLWDVLEHLPDPGRLLSRLPSGVALLLSLPCWGGPADWSGLGDWRHYRPGEHLWYWTEAGIRALLGALGYRVEWSGWPETSIGGRLDILSLTARRS
jgi:hypothetical protein